MNLNTFVEKRQLDDESKNRKQAIGDRYRVPVPPTKFTRNGSKVRDEPLGKLLPPPSVLQLEPEPFDKRETRGFKTGSGSINHSSTSSFAPDIKHSSKLKPRFTIERIAIGASIESEELSDYTKDRFEKLGLPGDEAIMQQFENEDSSASDSGNDIGRQNVPNGLHSEMNNEEFIDYKKRNILNTGILRGPRPSQDLAPNLPLSASSQAPFGAREETLLTSSRSPSPSNEVDEHNVLDQTLSIENEARADIGVEITQRSLKRKPSLDHNFDQLHSMAFQDLLNEPFDSVLTPIQSPDVPRGRAGVAGPSLRATLEGLSSHQSIHACHNEQQSFFEKLSLGEYLECGEMIAEHLNGTIANLSQIRQEKRKIVGEFEAEVVQRESTVRARVEALKRKKEVMTRQTEELTTKNLQA